jgi:hypothetical protein
MVRFKVGFKVGFKVVSHFFWAHGFRCFLFDRHPLATAVPSPCSLSQGFKEAIMRITLFHSFHLVLFLPLWCITRGGNIEYTGLSRRQRCLVLPEAKMSHAVGDRYGLYSLRWRYLVWPETLMSGMAGNGDISYGQRR